MGNNASTQTAMKITALNGKTQTITCTHCSGTGDCGCETARDELGYYCEECRGAGWKIV
jgi:hypothetical protein